MKTILRALIVAPVLWTLVALLVLLFGCSFAQPEPLTGGLKPYAGNYICTTNPADVRAIIVAQAVFRVGENGRANIRDGTVIRAMEVRQAKPHQRVCYRWPWISDVGRVGIVIARDTIWYDWFNPWP